MLHYRVGASSSRGAHGMAHYVLESERVPQLQQKLASYYTDKGQDTEIGTVAAPRMETHPVVAAGFGVELGKPLHVDQLAQLMDGKRADGTPIAGKAPTKNSYFDFVFSAPKSFTVALIHASPAERELLEGAYRDAVSKLMTLIADDIGTASVGRTAGNRARNREPGHILMVPIEHYTARPTYQLACDGDTQFHPVMVAGDPHRHTHIITFNAAFTEMGRVTSLYQEGMAQKIHEWGSLGQAFLSTSLQALGVNTELDSRPGLAFNDRMLRLTDIPQFMSDLHSKRHADGDSAARGYALAHGFDFAALSPKDKAAMLTAGIMKVREKKANLNEYESWMQQAKDAGYHHRSVLRPDEIKPLRPTLERQREAFELAKPMLAEHLVKRHVLEGSVPRVVAAKAFIQTGIEHASEVNVITAAMRSEGVMQDGVKTELHWAPERGKRYSRVSTQLSVEMEQEAIGLLREASEDKSASASDDVLARAVKRVVADAAAKGVTLDFTTPSGQAQLTFGRKIAQSGMAAAGVGWAGAGKSVSLRIPVEAGRMMGRDQVGIAVAWRQTHGLKDAGVSRHSNGRQKRIWVPKNQAELLEAGIAAESTWAVAPFIKGVAKGKIKVGPNTDVFVDEFALIGTGQLLQLARLRKEHGFRLIKIGDDEQYSSIEAGASVDLCRKAYGAENVPELTYNIRQSERDAMTSALWRAGEAGLALERKDQDGTLRIVPGGYAEAIAATVDLWAERHRANAGLPGYTLGISVPTNADSQAIGAEILSRRRRAGEVSHRDLLSLDACDQSGQTYSLTVAPGVRLRLFDRVRGQDPSGRWAIAGDNGTVVEMISHNRSGITVRKPSGLTATIAWDALRQNGGPIRLSYGDAVTGNARQSDTLTDHITSMPSGSSGVNGFGIYTMDSRSKQTGWVVTSQGAEKQQVQERRPLGDPRNHETDPALVKAAILANMAKNLGQQPKKTLAVDFLEQSPGLQSGQVEAGIAPWMPGAVQAGIEAPKPVRTTPVFPAEPPKTTIELMAEVVARGDVRYERAVDQLLEYWEVAHPRPTREQAIAAAQSGVEDPYREWDESRYQAECEIDHKLDVLVDKASTGSGNILSQEQRDIARVNSAAITNAQQIAQQQQRDIHKDHQL